MFKRTKIIAHRGASADAPENTLESVQLAWRQNTDAVEIDVQLTADGEIVVFHDDDTGRMTGESGLLKDIIWPELRRLKIERNGIQTHIPLLSDILPTIPQDKFLVIELKSGPEIVPPLRRLMDTFQIKCENVQFISLIEETIQKVFIDFPGYETQRVFEFLGEEPNTKELLHYAKQTPFTGIDLEAGDYLTEAFIKEIHRFNKKIYVWTVDDLSVAQQLAEFGIDGITTNRPGYLRANLETLL